MEKKVENAIISYNPKSKTTLDHNPLPKPVLKKGSSKGSKNFFKVALYMVRGHSRKSKSILPIDNESKSIWGRLVGSMRPMHLQSNQSPPQILNGENNNITNVVIENNGNSTKDIQGEDGFENGSEFRNSPSPARSGFASAASSRYASAVGLNEMVEEEEKEEEIVNKDKNDGDGDDDDKIDAKADEFIAQFYQQMKLQRMHIASHRYNRMSMRSLGLL